MPAADAGAQGGRRRDDDVGDGRRPDQGAVAARRADGVHGRRPGRAEDEPRGDGLRPRHSPGGRSPRRAGPHADRVHQRPARSALRADPAAGVRRADAQARAEAGADADSRGDPYRRGGTEGDDRAAPAAQAADGRRLVERLDGDRRAPRDRRGRPARPARHLARRVRRHSARPLHQPRAHDRPDVSRRRRHDGVPGALQPHRRRAVGGGHVSRANQAGRAGLDAQADRAAVKVLDVVSNHYGPAKAGHHRNHASAPRGRRAFAADRLELAHAGRIAIAEVLHRRLSQPVAQLGEVKARGCHRDARRFERLRRNSRDSDRVAVPENRRGTAGASDAPVLRTGRLLDDQVIRLHVPRDGPPGAPAVAGARVLAVRKRDARTPLGAVRELAAVHEQAGGPPLMRRDARLIAREIENHVRPGDACLRHDGPDAFAADARAMHENLRAGDGDVGRRGWRREGHVVTDVHILERHSPDRWPEGDGVLRILDRHIAYPSVAESIHAQEGVLALSDRHILDRSRHAQRLNPDLFNAPGERVLNDRRTWRIQICGVVGVGERHLERHAVARNRFDDAVGIDERARLDPGLRFAVAAERVHLHETDPRLGDGTADEDRVASFESRRRIHIHVIGA